MKVLLTPFDIVSEELDHEDIEEDCGTHSVPGESFSAASPIC